MPMCGFFYESLDPSDLLRTFSSAHPSAGAIVSFTGQVRSDGGVERLELRHYAPLTLPGLRVLAQDVRARWSLEGLSIIHRVGEMGPGEPILLVAAAARHRRAAFDAADFTMDHLKSRSWFWKRERRAGEWHWIEPLPEDFVTLERWRNTDTPDHDMGPPVEGVCLPA